MQSLFSGLFLALHSTSLADVFSSSSRIDGCHRVIHRHCPALEKELESWRNSSHIFSPLPTIHAYIGGQHQGLANKLGVYYFAVMLAASLYPSAAPTISEAGIKQLGGIFRPFPHVQVHESEVKRFNVATDSQLLCWTDWNNRRVSADHAASGCAQSNAHEANALSLCGAVLEAITKRPRVIIVGTYFHPSLFAHPWFRQHDTLVRTLYALPVSPPTPGTAIVHIRRCFVDPTFSYFLKECGPTAQHFYPSLPSEYVARMLRVLPNATRISASISPDCRFSDKMEHLRNQFPSLAASTPSTALPPKERGAHLANDQRADLLQMMRAEVFIADVGSFSAWIAYLRGLLFDGINHMPIFDYKPILQGRVWDSDFDKVPPQLVDAHNHAALGVSPRTTYHVVNRVGDESWFLLRKGACGAFTPDPHAPRLGVSAAANANSSGESKGKSPCG